MENIIVLGEPVTVWVNRYPVTMTVNNAAMRICIESERENVVSDSVQIPW